MKYALLMLAACGPGLATPERLEGGASLLAAAGDAGSIARLIHGSVTNGGLWFENPECVRQFPGPGKIDEDHRDAFAKCVATLHLQKSARQDAFIDVTVLTYAPGIEIEALIVQTRNGSRLEWIGYSGRRDLADALPTIAPEVLEGLRTSGDKNGPIDAASAENGAFAWVKVCIDTDGNVTGVHPREASSLAASRMFTAAAQAWHFHPFVVGNRAIPACALVRMVKPDAVPTPEVLPMPSTAADEPVIIPPKQLEARRISGSINLYPSDRIKVAIGKAGIVRVIGSFKLCLDETGRVVHVKPIRSTGISAYDEEIMRGVSKWVYRPYIEEDRAVPVCTAVTFIYNQR